MRPTHIYFPCSLGGVCSSSKTNNSATTHLANLSNSFNPWIADRAAALSSCIFVVSSRAGSGPLNSTSNRKYCSLRPSLLRLRNLCPSILLIESLKARKSLGMKPSLKIPRVGDMRGSSSARVEPVPKETTRLGSLTDGYMAATSSSARFPDHSAAILRPGTSLGLRYALV